MNSNDILDDIIPSSIISSITLHPKLYYFFLAEFALTLGPLSIIATMSPSQFTRLTGLPAETTVLGLLTIGGVLFVGLNFYFASKLFGLTLTERKVHKTNLRLTYLLFILIFIGIISTLITGEEKTMVVGAVVLNIILGGIYRLLYIMSNSRN